VLQDRGVTESAGWPAIPPEVLPAVLLRAVHAAAQGITITDATVPDDPLVYVNPAFLALTGYDRSEVIGRNCRFLQSVDTDPSVVAELGDAVRSGREATVVLLNHRKDGTTFWNEVGLSPVRDDTGALTHFIGYQVDVTERVRREQQLAERARTDALTGLTARGWWTEQLDEMLAAIEPDAEIALVYFDLEGFHRINDSFDFEIGNLVLAGVAARLQAIAEPGDLLARFDADAFVLARRVPVDHGAQEFAQIVQRMQRELATPIPTPAVPMTVHGQWGVAVSTTDGATADELVSAARRDLLRRRTTTEGSTARER
jgi:PAS domain S-box-containing protein/diguanylate cyclase (GGDEF)-like protein